MGYAILVGLFSIMVAVGGHLILGNDGDWYRWALGLVVLLVGQVGFVITVQNNYEGPCDDNQAFVISADGDQFCVEVKTDEQQTLEA